AGPGGRLPLDLATHRGVDRLDPRRRPRTGGPGGAGPPLPGQRDLGRARSVAGDHLLHPRRAGAGTVTDPSAPDRLADGAPPGAAEPDAVSDRPEDLVTRWERFLFAPESPSPMALVRAAWGAVVALWALSLLPDVDPFLTEGALRYERSMPDGHWNPLDWIGWSGAPLAACGLL